MQNFIVLDIETVGLDAVKNSMVSLGAIDYESGEEFYGECRIREGTEIDDFALKVNGFTKEQCLDKTKCSPQELYDSFLQWCKWDCRNMLLAGQQVGSFDAKFLEYLHNDLYPKQKFPFGYKSIDLHSVAFAKFGESLSLDGILNKLLLPSEPRPHNALTGARLERDAFKLLLS